jgi:2-polyprenyl-3-methyl-5-hydroxy-6-metoxy-1,4-benzoquinol methylase
MKTKSYLIQSITLIISSLLIGACSIHQTKHSTHHTNHANEHMHKKHSHEELIKRFDDPKRHEWQQPEKVIKILSPLKSQKVMDIGVGSGYFSKYFLEAGAFVTGADVDAQFLDFVQTKFPSKEYPNFSTRKIQYDDPLVQNNEFDLIFICNTYHHIDQRVTYLKKLIHGIKPTGKIAIVDFKMKSDSTIGPPQKLRLSEEHVLSELQQAGFSKIKVLNDVLPEQYIILGYKK